MSLQLTICHFSFQMCNREFEIKCLVNTLRQRLLPFGAGVILSLK